MGGGAPLGTPHPTDHGLPHRPSDLRSGASRGANLLGIDAEVIDVRTNSPREQVINTYLN
jgi:hypothetical protein